MSTNHKVRYPLGHVPKGTVLIPDTELDTRSDEEIIKMLQSSGIPPRDERNVWAYWHTGFDAMPLWTKRNVIHWARVLGPSWMIRVLDNVPGSLHNASHFVPSDLLPPAMRARAMEGPYSATHSADFVRLPLLFLYGGCWLDVGAILMQSLEGIWRRLEDPKQPYEFAGLTYETRPGETSIINGWIMARKNNELIRRWHATFLHVWGEATHCEGLWKHPLLRHLKPYAAPTDTLIMNENHKAVSMSRAIMDYGAQVHCLERLRDLVDADDGWDGRACVENTTFLLPMLKEMWYYQERTQFLGHRQFELLTTPCCDDSAADPQKRAEALALVEDMLANTMFMKFSHGLKDAMASSLADLWDDPANADADNSPGTFAEYLRWGTLHLRQTRELVPVKLTPAGNEPYRSRMFDPFPV